MVFVPVSGTELLKLLELPKCRDLSVTQASACGWGLVARRGSHGIRRLDLLPTHCHGQGLRLSSQ